MQVNSIIIVLIGHDQTDRDMFVAGACLLSTLPAVSSLFFMFSQCLEFLVNLLDLMSVLISFRINKGGNKAYGSSFLAVPEDLVRVVLTTVEAQLSNLDAAKANCI